MQEIFIKIFFTFFTPENTMVYRQIFEFIVFQLAYPCICFADLYVITWQTEKSIIPRNTFIKLISVKLFIDISVYQINFSISLTILLPKYYTIMSKFATFTILSMQLPSFYTFKKVVYHKAIRYKFRRI